MSATTNTVIDKQNERTQELKGLIRNHDCTLAQENDCKCIAWFAELNGERI